MTKKRRNLIVLVLGMVITKSFAFVQNLALSYAYGTSLISDAFILVLTLPNTVFGSISASLGQCYVPVYCNNKGQEKFCLSAYNMSLITSFSIIGLLVSCILFFFAEPVANLLAFGFSNESKDIVVDLIKIVAWSSTFVFYVGILQGYFQSKGHFFILAFISLPISIGIIVAIYMSFTGGTIALGVGVLLTYCFQAIILFSIAMVIGFKLSISRIKTVTPYLKKTIRMLLPLFLSSIIIDLNAMVDKSFATSIGVGMVSGMDYGYKVVGIAYAIIANPILTIEFPNISKLYSSKGVEKGNDYTKNLLFNMSIIYIFLLSFLFIFSREIVEVIFMRGNFDINSLNITSNSLALYSISILPMVFRNILDKVFIANMDTKTPLFNTLITVVMNIIGDIILSILWGYQGLIIATILSFAFSCFYLFKKIIQKYAFKFFKNDLKNFCVLFIIDLFVLIFFITIRHALFGNQELNTSAMILVLFLIFVFAALIYYFALLKSGLISKWSLKS